MSGTLFTLLLYKVTFIGSGMKTRTHLLGEGHRHPLQKLFRQTQACEEQRRQTCGAQRNACGDRTPVWATIGNREHPLLGQLWGNGPPDCQESCKLVFRRSCQSCDMFNSAIHVLPAALVKRCTYGYGQWHTDTPATLLTGTAA